MDTAKPDEYLRSPCMASSLPRQEGVSDAAPQTVLACGAALFFVTPLFP